ncbi:MAG: biotin/lipoyl-containing protein, partial [Armatimonadota bacterium]
MTEIYLPRVGATMEEGKILRWLKAVGDNVTAGEEIVEIETDKTNVVIEA